MTRGTSLWPCTPPWAFCRAMRALNPAGDVPFWDEPGPVSSVTYAMVIGAGDGAAVVADAPIMTIGRMTNEARRAFANRSTADLPSPRCGPLRPAPDLY